MCGFFLWIQPIDDSLLEIDTMKKMTLAGFLTRNAVCPQRTRRQSLRVL